MKIGIKNGTFYEMNPKMANRHGLISGATGTGKTVTLKVLAEQFSEMGVPVFLSDVKGDLSGFVTAGNHSEKFDDRMNLIGFDAPTFDTYPTVFWDLFKEYGIPVRTTVSEMGPLMLGRLLDLNEVQTGILYTVFKIADEEGLLLLDLKDLRKMLNYVTENRSEFEKEYGNINSRSIGAVLRSLIVLEEQGAENFFGEPALDIRDLMTVDPSGKGTINILDSRKLFYSPKMYSTFLLWLLSELFEELDEVGDVDKPRLVFFFDEAHLLFDDTPKFLLDKIEQVVKLIRSKGVGVYFVTQNPTDIPDEVLAQLGNRIQHALRAYTPKEQKAIRVIAQTFRENPDLDMEEEIMNLGLGEAMVSFLDDEGIPSITEKVFILPPKSKIGPEDKTVIDGVVMRSFLGGKYSQEFDRHSAYEELNDKAQRREEMTQSELEAEAKRQAEEDNPLSAKNIIGSVLGTNRKRRGDSPLDRMTKSAMSAIGYQIGRQVVRGILGSFTKNS